MRKREVLELLKKKGYIERGGFLRFDNFRSFEITRSFILEKEEDHILVIISKNKYFEYWIEQDLLIPPWETHWFQLGDSFFLKLKGNLLNEIIYKAVEKAESLHGLVKKLGMSSPTFYNFYNNKGNIKMLSVKKLKRILNYFFIIW